MKKINSLKKRINLFYIVIPVVLFCIFAVYSIISQHNFTQKRAGLVLDERLALLENSLKNYLENFSQNCSRICYDVQLIVPLQYQVKHQVYDFLKKTAKKEDLYSIFIIDNKLEPVVSNTSTKDFFLEKSLAKIPELILRDTFFRSIDGIIYAYCITPIEYKSNYLGHLVAIKKLDLNFGFENSILISDENIQAMSPHSNYIAKLYNKHPHINYSETIIKNSFFLRRKIIKDFQNLDIGEIIYGVDRVSELKYNRSYYISLFITFIIILISVLIFGTLLGRAIAIPIIELANVSEKIINENENIVPKYTASNDEIKVLYDNISKMVDYLIKSQDELRMSKIKAEDSSRTKSQFLANMSHEIRTPLNGIIGISSILLEQNLPDETLSYVNLINKSGTKLLLLVNDILDLSKIEEGKLIFEDHIFNIYECINSALDIHRFQAESKNVKVLQTISDDIPELILGDEKRLEQVIMNLVGNSVKFTEKGEINFNSYLENTEERIANIHFEVSDTGIGIPLDRVKHIFDAFTQADGSTTRKYGGTGLGTTISKQIVEELGGKIWIETPNLRKKSNVGGPGTVFHFIIPFSIPESNIYQNEQHKSYFRFPSAKLLVAEDNVTNQLVISKLLDKLEIKYKIVDNGKKVIEELLIDSYDLVLMDIQMPIMNGLEAVEELRKLGVSIPVIALTANAMKGDLQEALKKGMNAYLTKPIKLQEFSTLLKRWLIAEETRIDIEKSNLPNPNIIKKVDIFDLDKAVEILDSKDIVRDVIALFISDYPNLVEKITTAVEEKDYVKLHLASHSLKGASANLVLSRINIAAKNIEDACVNENYKAIRNLVKILKLRLDEFFEYIENNPI